MVQVPFFVFRTCSVYFLPVSQLRQRFALGSELRVLLRHLAFLSQVLEQRCFAQAMVVTSWPCSAAHERSRDPRDSRGIDFEARAILLAPRGGSC